MANWNGGVIGAANIPTTTVASGMWPLAEVNQYISSGDWPPLETSDPYFQNNVLLLHGDGTNGAQNNTFLDSSTNNFTITRNGNTTQGTFSPFSKPDGGWGNYFDGTGDYLSVADSAAFEFGSGDFTVEGWINPSALPTGLSSIVTKSNGTGGAYAPYLIGRSNSNIIVRMSSSGSSWDIANAVSFGTLTAGQWFHFALVRNGTAITGYLNGVGTTIATTSASLWDNSNALLVGAIFASSSYIEFWNGYISNVRLVKGTAVYTSNFTPPTAPLTAVSGTSLLTCQSNRFIDNSTNNFTITRNGDVKVTPFSPFPLTVPYSPSVNGGSGYFDGTGDYLTTPGDSSLVLDDDFTIEFFMYLNSLSISGVISSNHTSFTGTAFATIISHGTASNKISFWVQNISSSYLLASSTLTTNQWYHVAFVRSSGTIKLYLNGTEEDSYLTSGTITLYGGTGSLFRIGQYWNGSLNGHISDLRIVKGSAVYTSDFTPPTSPLTAIANTSVLTNFTNSGILDNTGFNNLETVGNAQIDTTVKKYGTGSIYIPATSDGAKTVSGVSLIGDFTIEFWSKSTLTGGEKFIILQGRNLVNGFLITASQTAIRWRSNGLTDIQYVFPTINTDWYHVAIVRNGTATNNVTVYYDGTSVVSGTYTNQILPTAGALYVGPASQISAGFAGTGHIDDLRITDGIARYTSNFTPPAAAFPNIGE